jgi:hypothetical protein
MVFPLSATALAGKILQKAFIKMRGFNPIIIAGNKAIRKVVYFWIASGCALTMTLFVNNILTGSSSNTEGVKYETSVRRSQ